MKKFLTTLCCACLLLAGANAQKTDKPFDFPIKPGSAQWQAFKTVQDMYDACQIPAAVLSNLSTQALIQTCLNYPAWTVLLIHNTPQQGFNTWRQHFNGIDALYKRSDAIEELLAAYAAYDLKGHQKLATDVEKGSYTFKLKMLEIIMAQKDFIGKLSSVQQKQLIKTSLSHYTIMEADTVYGFTALASVGRVIAGVAAQQPAGRLKASAQSAEASEFIKTGLLANREILAAIIAEARRDH